MQMRVHEALDLVDVVIGRQLTRTGVSEVGERGIARDVCGFEIMIVVAAVSTPREGRVWLIENAVLQADGVDRFRNRCGGRVVGQRFTIATEVTWLGQRGGGERHELVRTFQKVVLQHRLVDLTGELCFVFAIGRDRVQMFGSFGKCAVEDCTLAIGGRIRIVPCSLVATDQARHECDETDDYERGGRRGSHVRGISNALRDYKLGRDAVHSAGPARGARQAASKVVRPWEFCKVNAP